MNYVFTFDSVHFVMKAEKILMREKVKVRLIPTPRKISSDCGMAIEVQCKDIEKIKRLLETNDCVPIGIHIHQE